MARDEVAVTDLEVIARYSLAVRAPAAGREELIATLRADLAWLEGGGPDRADSPEDYEGYDDYNEPPPAPRPAPAPSSPRAAGGSAPGAVRREAGAVRREPGRAASPGADRSPASASRTRGRTGR